MKRYALYALPGPGDEVLRQTEAVGHPPSLLVHAKRTDFVDARIERVLASEDLPAVLKKSEIETIVVAGWESRIPSSHYSRLRYGGWNIHPSLLPRYRGHNPYFWVIARGESHTGVTVHRLDDEYDTGPILFRKECAIDSRETLGSLWMKLAALSGSAAVDLLKRLMDPHAIDDDRLEAQDQKSATVAPKIKPEQLILHPKMTCTEGERFVRACNPFYGAYYRMDDGSTIQIFETGSGSGPRLVFADGELTALVVRTERGFMSGAEYLRSR